MKLRHAVVCGFLGWAAAQKSAYHPHFLHTCRFSSVDCCSSCETDYRITCGFLPLSAVFWVFLWFSENTHFIADTVTNTQFYSTEPFFCVVLRISVFSTFCPQGPSSLSFRPSPFELRDSKHMGYCSGNKCTYELIGTCCLWCHLLFLAKCFILLLEVLEKQCKGKKGKCYFESVGIKIIVDLLEFHICNWIIPMILLIVKCIEVTKRMLTSFNKNRWY